MNQTFAQGDLAIRPFRPEDVPLLFQAVEESRLELKPWMIWYHDRYALEDSANFVNSREIAWQRGEHYSFVIHHLQTQWFLGGIGLNFLNRVHNFANIGYWVRTSATRCGVASGAVRLIARFGFEVLGLQRLEIVVDPANQASCRAALKAGARQEALLRNRIHWQGQPRDAYMFALLPEDLRR